MIWANWLLGYSLGVGLGASLAQQPGPAWAYALSAATAIGALVVALHDLRRR